MVSAHGLELMQERAVLMLCTAGRTQPDRRVAKRSIIFTSLLQTPAMYLRII